MENDVQNQPPKRSRNFALALGASQMGLFVAAGLLGGLWLDKKWGTTPWLGFVGLVAGFVSGIRLLVALVKSND